MYYRKLTQKIVKDNITNLNEILKLRDELAKKYHPTHLPSLIQILVRINDNKFLKSLKIKPVRTISGVAPVAIMTYPEKCKHGVCVFCPGGPNSYFGNVPQSYTGNEPAAMRAIRNLFDPYLQVFNRLQHYILLGHFPDKIELIVMGGTFPSHKKQYQDEFITYAIKAMNDFSEMFFKNNEFNFIKFKKFYEMPHEIGDKEVIKKIQNKLLEIKGNSTLEKEQLRNETTKVRCVVMNVETKPDWCFKPHINQMLKLGVTRIEVGIQTLYDNILKTTNRGHTLEDTEKAIQLTKDSFLKTCMHMMVGLPKTTKEMDLYNFTELFKDENYKPDALKIYPCMVMSGTPLYLQYQKGEFKPITTEEAGELLLKVKPLIPRTCRVMRIQRDIPTKVTIDGVNITNFRQYLHELMKKKNIKCKCIRCREPKNRKLDYDRVKLNRINYDSSCGKEIFLSFDDMKNDILLGFIRLRIPYKPFRPEITNKSAGIREIHIYGSSVPIGKKSEDVQHRGYGSKLLEEAEKISREEFDIKKILIISGIGTKRYFMDKFDYKKDGVYVSKFLKR